MCPSESPYRVERKVATRANENCSGHFCWNRATDTLKKDDDTGKRMDDRLGCNRDQATVYIRASTRRHVETRMNRAPDRPMTTLRPESSYLSVPYQLHACIFGTFCNSHLSRLAAAGVLYKPAVTLQFDDLPSADETGLVEGISAPPPKLPASCRPSVGASVPDRPFPCCVILFTSQ